MAAASWKVREITFVRDRMYGQVGLIGAHRLFAFYWTSGTATSATAGKPYTLECFLPGIGKWPVRDLEHAHTLARQIVSEYIDSLVEA